VEVEGLYDGVVTEVDLLSLVGVAGQVVPGVLGDGVGRVAGGAGRREDSAIWAESKVESSTDNIVSSRQRVCVT
jgi:hypothetical protein